MDNAEQTSKKPNVIQKAVLYIKHGFKVLTDIYFIQISLVSNSNPNPLVIPEILEKQYLILKDHDEIDYTKDLKKASQFKAALGTMIVNKLRKSMKDSPNIKIDLVPVSQANFINEIINGK